MIKKLIKKIVYRVIESINKSESRRYYNANNERCIEFAYLFKELTRIWPKSILDVGTGMSSLPHLLHSAGFNVTAVDNISDYWSDGLFNRHFYIENDDITKTRLKGKFDVILCISVLEHINDYDEAVKNMTQLLSNEGRLIMTFPYHENCYHENVYSHPDSSVSETYKFKTQAFSRKELLRWISANSLEIESQTYWDFFNQEYWACGNILEKPAIANSSTRHQLSCVTFIKKKHL